MRVTVTNIDRALAERGIPLAVCRADGYIYFYALNADTPFGMEDCVPSIMSTRLTDMTVGQYVAHVTDYVTKFREDTP